MVPPVLSLPGKHPQGIILNIRKSAGNGRQERKRSGGISGQQEASKSLLGPPQGRAGCSGSQASAGLSLVCAVWWKPRETRGHLSPKQCLGKPGCDVPTHQGGQRHGGIMSTWGSFCFLILSYNSCICCRSRSCVTIGTHSGRKVPLKSSIKTPHGVVPFSAQTLPSMTDWLVSFGATWFYKTVVDMIVPGRVGREQREEDVS